MLRTLAALAFVLGFASGAIAATSTSKLSDGRTLVVSASAIDGIGPGSTKLVLTGKAHVKMFEKSGGASVDASADKIVAMLGASAVGSMSGGIKSAELTGSPRVVYEIPDPQTGRPVRTVATSNSASYDGATETLTLRGNVKITNENPLLFQGPAEMTGDLATISLSNKLGPEDTRFSISSSPGVSTITATPKPKEATKSSQ